MSASRSHVLYHDIMRVEKRSLRVAEPKQKLARPGMLKQSAQVSQANQASAIRRPTSHGVVSRLTAGELSASACFSLLPPK